MEENRISQTHVWRRAENIKSGDKIHRWGDDLEVTEVLREGIIITIFYLDDGVIKALHSNAEQEFIVWCPTVT
jgi:hypothetical protein